MLSEEEKREMLEDAQSAQRHQAFDEAKKRSLKPMSWEKYFQFLQSVQDIFPQQRSPHKIQGNSFKL